jgi:hypothetical protein
MAMPTQTDEVSLEGLLVQTLVNPLSISIIAVVFALYQIGNIEAKKQEAEKVKDPTFATDEENKLYNTVKKAMLEAIASEIGDTDSLDVKSLLQRIEILEKKLAELEGDNR